MLTSISRMAKKFNQIFFAEIIWVISVLLLAVNTLDLDKKLIRLKTKDV